MSLWFVVPAHGRYDLTRICLRQLRRTCDRLTDVGIHATTIVIADDQNLDTAFELGFGTYRQNNEFLSRKFNDGIQAATDPDINPRPADYVVPCGRDDWVDHHLFLDLPAPDTMVGFQAMSFVREDGLEMRAKHLNYMGGCGIRIYPRQLMETVGYRPADESRKRGCDTSILINLRQYNPGIQVKHPLIDPRQIVDWKSPDEQLNSYDNLNRHRTLSDSDPFEALADIYPAESLDEMREHYTRRLVPA